jgi:SAM-dependent methyltransferase
MRDGKDGRWLKPSYEASYHQTVYGSLIESELYYELRSRQAKRDLFDGIVDDDAEVFEFGVGTGKNIAQLRHKSGYDLSEFAREFSAKKGIRVYDDMAKVPDAHFDVVLSSHVLEHLPDPGANLELLATKLKPTGKLVLVLPVEKHRHVPFDVDVDQHLYAWNFRTINNLLARVGFRVLENRYRYGTLQYKLRALGKLSFHLYDLNTRLFGRVLDRRDQIIVAERR